METRRITVALVVGLGLTIGLLLVLNGAVVLPVRAAPRLHIATWRLRAPMP